MQSQEKLSNEICNYFFQNCGATISKKDYDKILEMLNKLLEEHTLT